MRPETLSLNQSLILGAIEGIEHWEHWAEIVPRGPTKTLNQQLIRLSKGLVKAWRQFLVEHQRNGNQPESVSSQRSALSPSAETKEITS
jgi:hypothetical protein